MVSVILIDFFIIVRFFHRILILKNKYATQKCLTVEY